MWLRNVASRSRTASATGPSKRTLSMMGAPRSDPAKRRNCTYAPGTASIGRGASISTPSTVGVGSATDMIIFVAARRSSHRAVVAGQHVGAERTRQIEILEPRQVEIGEGGAAHGPRVEGRVPVAPFLVEDPFVLRAGQRPAGADPGPDASAEAHRRRVGRRDGHHRHALAAEHVLADRHRRRRQDVAVRLAVGELEQQGVVDFQAGGRAVVPHADEDDPRTASIRQIVGERADGLAHGARRIAVEGLLALDEVRLDVGHHRLEFDVRIGGAHASFRKPADHSMVAYRPRPYRAVIGNAAICPGDPGLPRRFIGRRSMNACRTSGPPPRAAIRSSSEGGRAVPGRMVLHRTPPSDEIGRHRPAGADPRIRPREGEGHPQAGHREAELRGRFRTAADPPAAA